MIIGVGFIVTKFIKFSQKGRVHMDGPNYTVETVQYGGLIRETNGAVGIP